MFKGYNPKDFPAENRYFSGFRVGERLYRYQTAYALAVSENIITRELNELYQKLNIIGFLDWNADRASSIRADAAL
jgi:hypothetical protein